MAWAPQLSRRQRLTVPRYASGAITLTTLMVARPTATTDLTGSMVEYSSAQGLGTDGAMAGVAAVTAIVAATDIAVGTGTVVVDMPEAIAVGTEQHPGADMRVAREAIAAAVA